MLSNAFGQAGLGDILKESDLYKTLAEGAKHREKLAQLEKQQADAKAKMTEAIQKLGNMPALQQPEMGHITPQEGNWALGLSILGRALGGDRAAPGINQGFNSYLAGRQKSLQDQYTQELQRRQQEQQSLQNQLQSQADIAKFNYTDANNRFTDENNQVQSLERQDLINHAKPQSSAETRAATASYMVQSGAWTPAEGKVFVGSGKLPNEIRGIDARTGLTVQNTEDLKRKAAWAIADRPTRVKLLADELTKSGNAIDLQNLDKTLKNLNIDNYGFNQALKLVGPMMTMQQMVLTLQNMQRQQEQFNKGQDMEAWKASLGQLDGQLKQFDKQIGDLDSQINNMSLQAQYLSDQAQTESDPVKADALREQANAYLLQAKPMNARKAQLEAQRNAIKSQYDVLVKAPPGKATFSFDGIPGFEDLWKKATGSTPVPIKGGKVASSKTPLPGNIPVDPMQIDPALAKRLQESGGLKKIKAQTAADALDQLGL